MFAVLCAKAVRADGTSASLISPLARQYTTAAEDIWEWGGGNCLYTCVSTHVLGRSGVCSPKKMLQIRCSESASEATFGLKRHYSYRYLCVFVRHAKGPNFWVSSAEYYIGLLTLGRGHNVARLDTLVRRDLCDMQRYWTMRKTGKDLLRRTPLRTAFNPFATGCINATRMRIGRRVSTQARKALRIGMCECIYIKAWLQ